MRHVYSTVIMNTKPSVLYNLMIVLAKACLSVSQPTICGITGIAEAHSLLAEHSAQTLPSAYYI